MKLLGSVEMWLGCNCESLSEPSVLEIPMCDVLDEKFTRHSRKSARKGGFDSEAHAKAVLTAGYLHGHMVRDLWSLGNQECSCKYLLHVILQTNKWNPKLRGECLDRMYMSGGPSSSCGKVPFKTFGV